MEGMRLAVTAPAGGQSTPMEGHAALGATSTLVGAPAHPRSAEAGDRREERRLLREAQRGSEEALASLVRRTWPLAHRAAYLILGDAAAAEDVAQEALVAAIRALDRFDRRRPFGPWLHRIAVNRAIDHARARGARGEVPSGTAEDAERRGPEGGVPTASADPRADGLAAALAELSPEHRAIVAMRFLLELTPGEIAAELGLPRGTVNSRIRRALDQLADRLGEGDRG
jgi:RNA polymerase sigma-70 factor (ECF subfamily)